MATDTNNGKHTELQIQNDVAALMPADPASYELRVLDPRRTRVFRVAGVTRLTIENDRSWAKVTVARAFPLSDPDHYLGFLDGGGKDIGLLIDPAPMDAESRVVVDEELEKRYFVPVVERVLSVKEEFGTVYWKVETDRGEKEIVARNLRENIMELSSSRLIITDIDNNRFEFPDTNKLDGRSLGIIMRNL